MHYENGMPSIYKVRFCDKNRESQIMCERYLKFLTMFLS